MKLENQVCSLELAKKLKELRVKQESLFFWGFDNQEGFSGGLKILQESNYAEQYSAFTVAELGEMLPDKIKEYTLHIYNNPEYLKKYKYERTENWSCGYELQSWDVNTQKHYWKGWFVWEHAKTEADARAKMLIYLLENNLMKL